MKNILITTTILLALAISCITVEANGAISENATFTISANHASENGLEKESWIIKYSEANKKISIEKNSIKNGEEYIVRNDFFEVRYTNTDKGFGVKKIKKAQSTINPMINNAVINSSQMSNQSLLNSNKLSEEKALNYIASFVPLLLNENYNHLLN